MTEPVRFGPRQLLAYLVTVTLGVWVFAAIQDVQQDGDLVSALIVAARSLLESGLVWLAFAGVLLLPAMVLTIELVHRSAAPTRAARSVLGAASWAGWGLFGAMTLALVSQLTLVPEWLAGDILLFAAAGAGFSVLALDGHDTRVGRALTVLALAVVAVVILGSLWMAGRWGGAA